MAVEFTSDNIKIALKYINDKVDDFTRNTDELARRMGVDPANDLLVIPEDWLRKLVIRKPNPMPKWLSVSTHSRWDKPGILKNVRNPKAKKTA